MTEIRYTDFDLLIERSGENQYRVRVLYSPAGQAVRDMTLPFTPLELENFLLKVGRTRRGVRRLESMEMEAAKTFGGKLFKSVFQEEIMSTLRRSLEEAQKNSQGLRLRLRLNDAPELLNLPWEYLYNPALNRFLSLSVSTPVVRYLELPERIIPLTIEPPLKMMVVISSPSDYAELDVEREWNNLTTALGELVRRGLLEVERLEVASPIALQTRLRREEYHIFHFIGHGGYDEQAQDGLLLLEDEGGRGRPLSGQYLGTLLHDEKTLRLAVLNACEGGRTGMSDPFSGVAQSLVQQGLPAVIAMQFEVTDAAAITFAREFYTAIADNYPVDASLAEARKAIFSLGNDIEWGTPVLYMRAPDGVIFDVSKAPESAEEPAARSEPEEPGAVEPQPETDLEKFYQEAMTASEEDDWGRAWELLRQISEIDPGYQDVQTRLDQARTQLLLANLYKQAGQMHQQGKWQATISKIEQIQAIQPDYPDPEGLLASAKGHTAEVARQERLQNLYRQAREAMQSRRWKEAIELWFQVMGIEPGYREAERLLALARAELEGEETQAQSRAAAPLPSPAGPSTSAVVATGGRAPAGEGAQSPPTDKPRNRWLLFGIGGSGVLVLVFALSFLFGILPPHPPATDTITPTLTPTSTPPTGTLTPTLTPTSASGGGGVIELPTDTPTPTPTPTVTPVPALEGIYRIQAVADGLFWHLDGGGDNLLSTRYQPDDDYTRFVLEPQADGSHRIRVLATGLYLHEDGLATLLVDQIDEEDDFTRFYLEPKREGIYRIWVKASGRYLHYDELGDRLVSTRSQEDTVWTEFRLIPAGESAVTTDEFTTTVTKVIHGDADGNPLGFFIQSGDGQWTERGLEDEVSFSFEETARGESTVYLQDRTRDYAIELDLENGAVMWRPTGDSDLVLLYDILWAETILLPQDPVTFVEDYWRDVSEGNYVRSWASLSHAWRESSSHNNEFSSYAGFADQYCAITTNDVRLLEEIDDSNGRRAIVAGSLIYDTCDAEIPYSLEITLVYDELLQDWLYGSGDIARE